MTTRWVLLIKLNGSVQAELLRGLLEAQDIQVLLAQEGAAKAIGINVGALGQIDVMVPEEREAEAREIMEGFFGGEYVE